MAAIDDMKTAVDTLSASVNSISTALTEVTAALQARGGNDATLQGFAGTLNTLASQLDAAVVTLHAELNPPAPVV